MRLTLLVAAMVAAQLTTVEAQTAQSSDREPAESALAARCEALRTFPWPDLVVDEARLVPAGPPVEQGPQSANLELPRHCMLRATVAPRTGAHDQHLGIGVDLRLP